MVWCGVCDLFGLSIFVETEQKTRDDYGGGGWNDWMLCYVSLQPRDNDHPDSKQQSA